MAGTIAKRRVSIDPRQIALDFDGPGPLVPPLSVVPETPPEAALRIATRLTTLVGPCDLVWTENRRTVLSSLRRRERMTVRIHRIFERAPDELIDAIGRYLASGERRASAAISRYVDAHRGSISRARPPRALEARGNVHDLASIFDELHRDHFGAGSGAGPCDGVGITWGRHGHSPRRRRRSIRLGTYSHEERVIRVHPTLDQAWIPRFFVRFIVFHEMLHHVEPARITDTRTEFHTPAFRARERAYPEYERSIAWERANLGRLLRG